MCECACCGAALECRRRQPASRGDGETEHFRCPDCGEGGFRVLGPNGCEERTGGPAFEGAPDRRATVQDADDGILIADGSGVPDPPFEQQRQADALERVADELAYQNAVLTEIVRTLDDVAGEDRTVRSPTAINTAIDDHRFTREEEGR